MVLSPPRQTKSKVIEVRANVRGGLDMKQRGNVSYASLEPSLTQPSFGTSGNFGSLASRDVKAVSVAKKTTVPRIEEKR